MYGGVFLHGMRVRRGCWRTGMWRRVDITGCRVCDGVQSSARARAFHMRWAGPRREVGGLGGLSRPDRDGSSSIGVAFLSEPTSMCGGAFERFALGCETDRGACYGERGSTIDRHTNSSHTRTSSPVSHIHYSSILLLSAH